MSKALMPAAVQDGDPVVTDLPLMLVTPALFAANMVAARWAEAANIPPVFLAFGRWTVASLILLPSVAPRIWAQRGTVGKSWMRILVLAALGMGVAVAPQYVGARHTSAANIGLIFAACPVLVALIEAILWKVPLGAMRLTGMCIAISGLLVVLSKGSIARLGELHFGSGDPWIALAAFGWSLYMVLRKRLPLPPMPGTERLAVLAVGGAVVLAPFACAEAIGGTLPDFGDSRLYVAICFLAIIPSLGAYFCFDRLAISAGPARASLAMYLVPLYATLAAWALLGEAPYAFHAVGFVCVIFGIILAGMQKTT